MAESEAFQTLSEFGIALAGFTSIVVVFGRGGGAFHPVDRFRVFSALIPSLGGAFLALLPVGLDLVGFSHTAVWRASSLVLVFAIITYLVFVTIQIRRLPPEASALLSSHLIRLFLSLFSFAILAGFLNVTGVLFSPQGGAYFFAVLSVLVIGAIVFVRMVFVRPAA